MGRVVNMNYCIALVGKNIAFDDGMQKNIQQERKDA